MSSQLEAQSSAPTSELAPPRKALIWKDDCQRGWDDLSNPDASVFQLEKNLLIKESQIRFSTGPINQEKWNRDDKLCSDTGGHFCRLQCDTWEFIKFTSLRHMWVYHAPQFTHTRLILSRAKFEKTLTGNGKEDMHLLFSLKSLSFCNALTEERNKYENISDSTSVLYVLEITLQTFMLLITVNFFFWYLYYLPFWTCSYNSCKVSTIWGKSYLVVESAIWLSVRLPAGS